MKRQFLLTRMLLLFALVVGSMNVWAADVVGTINFNGDATKISSASVTGDDSQGNTWTITTAGTTSYTSNASYYQVGSSSKPATSITFTTTLPSSQTIKAFSAKFGGFSGTAGDVTLKVGDTTVGSGRLNGTSDVIVSATNTTTSGTVLTVTVTNIAKGVKCYYISYTYSGGAASVSTPSFLPDGSSTYNTAQNVTISCATVGATIHYTMTEDGTTPDEPTESNPTYSSSISVTKSGTKIKAKAFKDGLTASSVATATYTIKPNQPTISAAGATVTITGDEGCTFYYTIDGNNPDNTKTEYTAPFNLDADCTIKAKAYDTYGNASDMKSLTFKYMPLAPKNINSGYYEKVTDVSSLENGDAILIVYESDKVAMSTTQNDNNRGQADVTISGSVIDDPSANVQKLVLVKTNESIGDPATPTDVFYFYTGTSGYLYAASSSKNYLRTETAPDENGNARATISISSGDATIHFTGTNSRKWLKYNTTSDLFSCYATDDSGQSAVQIYKEVTRTPSAPVDNGDNTITLTTTANMAGWRAFYDASQDYTLDENTKAYVVTAKSGTANEVELTKLNVTAIPHGEAVILKTSDAGYSMTLTKTTGVTTLGTNLLAVTKGTSNVDGYRLGYGKIGSEDAVGFFKYTTTTAPAAGIVYIDKSNVNISTLSRGLSISFADDETTGINAVENANGEFNNAVYYNLSGQRVANPSKGLYIVNGKKVIIK